MIQSKEHFIDTIHYKKEEYYLCDFHIYVHITPNTNKEHKFFRYFYYPKNCLFLEFEFEDRYGAKLLPLPNLKSEIITHFILSNKNELKEFKEPWHTSNHPPSEHLYVLIDPNELIVDIDKNSFSNSFKRL